jgi:hypothetical protein
MACTRVANPSYFFDTLHVRRMEEVGLVANLTAILPRSAALGPGYSELVLACPRR